MIKKYKAETQEQAIEMARKELGDSAIVLSIKKITPKGVLAGNKKPYVELTAINSKNNNLNQQNILDYQEKSATQELFQNQKNDTFLNKLFKLMEQKQHSQSLDNTQNENLINQINQKDKEIQELQKKLGEMEISLKDTLAKLNEDKNTYKVKYENSLVQFFYDLFKNQDICDAVCEELLLHIDKLLKNQELDIDFIVKILYNNILKILQNSEAKQVNLEKKQKPTNLIFLGTTGVGKTTTIAKISSNLMMKKGLKVGFVTLDTYRIAAVEQLKTYAEILNSDVEVIYDIEEIEDKLKTISVVNDVIFFDTAGRSHNNKENMDEIKNLLQKIPNAEKYLVLSATIKLEDMINIINSYAVFTDFKLIFTKLDETNTLGNILNIAKMTDKKIAYLSNGQNVPGDIEEFNPSKISKALLESMYK